MGNYYSLSGGIRIPNNADLKSAQYLIPGNYYCNNNTTAGSLSNCPFPKSAFLLKVEYSVGGTVNDYVRQIFKRYDDGAIISRIYFSSSASWSEEEQYATHSDLNKLSDAFEFEQRSAVVSMSDGYGEVTIDTRKVGYKCLGMVGHQVNNTYCYMYMALFDPSAENIKIGIRGTINVSQNPTVYVRFLYIREDVV